MKPENQVLEHSRLSTQDSSLSTSVGVSMKQFFSILLVVAVVVVAAIAHAQQPKKVARIGYLSGADPASESSPCRGTFRRGLRELGYIEGQNIAIEYRYAEGKNDRFPELAADLVRLKVDIIVVTGGNADNPGGQECDQDDSHRYDGRWVDPVEAGFVASLARPGGNVTGLTSLGPELGGKRLELLKEAVPKLSRVAVLYDPANPSSILSVKEVLPPAARALGLTFGLGRYETRAVSSGYSPR